jgi:sec-independent protein translocase protein TatC
LLLVKLDVLTAPDLKRIRAQAAVAILIFAAILTPTTDMITMLLMGGPMYLLYEMCIWIAVFMERKSAVLKNE